MTANDDPGGNGCNLHRHRQGRVTGKSQRQRRGDSVARPGDVGDFACLRGLVMNDALVRDEGHAFARAGHQHGAHPDLAAEAQRGRHDILGGVDRKAGGFGEFGAVRGQNARAFVAAIVRALGIDDDRFALRPRRGDNRLRDVARQYALAIVGNNDGFSPEQFGGHRAHDIGGIVGRKHRAGFTVRPQEMMAVQTEEAVLDGGFA